MNPNMDTFTKDMQYIYTVYIFLLQGGFEWQRKLIIQIMELIKEIAQEKLVIMVTHNSDLAHSYASRIIELKDGTVINDTKELKDNSKNRKEYKIKKELK